MAAEDQPLRIIPPPAHELVFPLQVGLLEPLECYCIEPQSRDQPNLRTDHWARHSRLGGSCRCSAPAGKASGKGDLGFNRTVVS